MTEGAPRGALVRLFRRLGFSGFGGPLVHIALWLVLAAGAMGGLWTRAA